MSASTAVCLDAPRGAIEVRPFDAANPQAGEVFVRMEACGICHSDVMIAGLEKLPLAPLILGHEGIGIVESIGENVSNVSVGDRVGITYLASGCGQCANCKSGRERFCVKQLNHGFTRHGALTTAGVMGAQNLVRIPAELSAEEAAPLCCAGWTAMGALTQAGLEPGQFVAIFGFGGLGHLAFQYARQMGLRTAVVDASEDKLAFAKELGAEVAVTSDNARKVLSKELGGVDASLVFTASAAAVPVAFSSLKRCGSLILVGLTTDACNLSIAETVLKGVRIQGSYLGSRADLERVIALASQGGIKPHVSTHAIDAAPELISKLKRGELKGRAVVRF